LEDETKTETERPKRAQRVPKQPGSNTDVLKGPVSVEPANPLPGRGGPRHKYLQSLIKRLAEDKGFQVSIEKAVLGGHGHVDVILERGGVSIGCEISVTTRVGHEIDNLSKCLAAGCQYAVLVSSDERTLSEAQQLLGDAGSTQVRFMTPDDLIAFLDEVSETIPSTGVGARTRVSSRRGGDSRGGTIETARPGMLIAKDAAAYNGLAQQTLAKMRWSGDSPPYFKVGRQVVYDRNDLDSWLALRRRRSTSDPS